MANIIEDTKTGIFHRASTFDLFILNESRGYFPMGLTRKDVLLDLGGHIGTVASRAKLECPECFVVSVEAQKDNFKVLEQNAVKFGFISELRAVVSSDQHEKDIPLYVNKKKNNALHSTVAVRGRPTEIVSGYGLKELFADVKHASGEVTILKVDVEGAEFELPWADVLPGKVRKIVIEFHLQGKSAAGRPRRQLATEAVNYFTTLGFTPTRPPVFTEKNWTTLAVFERTV